MWRFIVLLIFFGVSTASCGSAAKKSTSTSKVYDAELSNFDYPYEVYRFNFVSQRQNMQMAYMYLKSPDEKANARPVYILMHGKNFSGFYWKPVAELLLTKGFNVLIPDQVGFGKSTKPSQYQYAFSTLAFNTKKLTESLGIEASVIVGHSMGGMLATRYSLMYPEQVKKIILINPIGMEDYRYYVEAKDVDATYENEKKLTHAGVIEYQKKFYYEGKWSEEYEALTEAYRGWIAGPDWDLLAWNSALTFQMIFADPVVHEIKNLKPQVHLILGIGDKTAPGAAWKKANVTRELGRYDRLGKEWKKELPSLRLYELNGLAHMPQYQDFEVFKSAFEKAIAE